MKKSFKFILAAVIVLIAGASLYFYYENNLKLERSEFEVFFTGHVLGRVRTCGCSLQSLGGVNRRGEYLAQNATPPRLVLDFGNYFVNDLGKETKFAAEKRDLLLQLTKEIPYHAYNWGSKDAKLPISMLKDLPMVSLTSTVPEIPRSRTVEVNGTKYWITGINTTAPFPSQELKKEIDQLDRRILPVVLSDFSIHDNIEFLKSYSRPLLLIGSNSVYSHLFQTQVGPSVYVTGGDTGRFVARLMFEIERTKSSIKSLRSTKEAYVPMNGYFDAGSVGEKMLNAVEAWEKKHKKIDDD